MTVPVTQTFIPGPRLIDGTDLNNVVSQTNAGFAAVGLVQNLTNTAVSTVGDSTLTGAAIAGGQITRTGSTAVFTDTTPTAAGIVAAIPGCVAGQAFYLTISNFTAFAQTIAAGSGVTLAGLTVIPGLQSVKFLVKLTSLAAIAITGEESGPLVPLPVVKVTADSGQAATFQVGGLTGAQLCSVNLTGATPGVMCLPTAAAIVAATPNAVVGAAWELELINRSTSTVQISTNTGTQVTTFAKIQTGFASRAAVSLPSLDTVQIGGLTTSQLSA